MRTPKLVKVVFKGFAVQVKSADGKVRYVNGTSMGDEKLRARLSESTPYFFHEDSDETETKDYAKNEADRIRKMGLLKRPCEHDNHHFYEKLPRGSKVKVVEVERVKYVVDYIPQTHLI